MLIRTFRAAEGSRTLVSSLEGWGNEPLYDCRKLDDMTIYRSTNLVNSFFPVFIFFFDFFSKYFFLFNHSADN